MLTALSIQPSTQIQTVLSTPSPYSPTARLYWPAISAPSRRTAEHRSIATFWHVLMATAHLTILSIPAQTILYLPSLCRPTAGLSSAAISPRSTPVVAQLLRATALHA